MLTFSRTLPLLAAAALIAGCAQTPPASQATGTPVASAPARPAPPLTGTTWKLKQFNGHPVTRTPPRQRDVTIVFNDGRVSGHSGCNQMMGAYGTNGSSTLTFSQFAGTMMACEKADMDLENQLLKSLGTVNGYRFDGQQLLLLKDGVAVARYEAVK